MSKISTTIQESIKNVYSNRINLWKGSPFEKLTYLSNDERGKWGEEYIYNLLKENTSLDVNWNADCNTNNSDGVYDISINHNTSKVRVEIKTATRGNTKNSNWQHENIYSSNKWDKIILFDLDFQGFYVTVINHSDMTFCCRHPIFNRKPTLRNNQDDKYKFDFGEQQQKYGILNGLTFKFNFNQPDDKGLIEFLTSKLL